MTTSPTPAFRADFFSSEAHKIAQNRTSDCGAGLLTFEQKDITWTFSQPNKRHSNSRSPWQSPGDFILTILSSVSLKNFHAFCCRRIANSPKAICIKIQNIFNVRDRFMKFAVQVKRVCYCFRTVPSNHLFSHFNFLSVFGCTTTVTESGAY